MNKNFLTSRPERLSYAGYFVGQNIAFMFVLSFLTLFYTDVVGLSTGAVATLFLVARVWDAINDPILGAIVDRTTPKKGKFKPWISATIIAMPVATILVFWNIKGSGTVNLTYAYITYIIWGMIYTISDVPIFALATSMTDRVDERVTLISWGRLAAGLAGMIAAALGAPLVANMGFSTTIIVLMIIALLTMAPIHFLAKERVLHPQKDKVTLKSMINAVIKNKYLMIFYLSFIVIGGSNFAMTSGPYFAKWNLGNLELQGVLMITMIIPMLLLPMILPLLIRKFGKKKLYIYALSFGIIVAVIQFITGYDNLPLFLLLNVFKGAGAFLPMLMMGMFSADCAEYGAYITGKRNEGITFSIQTFSSKLSTAIAGSLGVALLGFFGYDGMAATQTEQALNGIWLQTTLFPIIGMFLGLIIFALFYKLDEKQVQNMIIQMEGK